MGMKALATAGNKADGHIGFGKAFNEFVNTNIGEVTAVRQAYDKKLNTVTDADIDAYFGVKLSAEAKVSEKAILEVMQDMIDIVQGIKDKLPANDL